jgi:ubiquinone/menaquinone biosynthesis C-methylase UbiE
MKFLRVPKVLQGEPAHRPFLRPEQILAQANLKPGERVVDLGSGSGFFTLPAAKLVAPKGGRVFAVDSNLELLSKLQKAAQEQGIRGIEPLGVDFAALPTHINEPIDLVVLARVLSRVADVGVPLRVAAELTKLGGRVLVVEWRPERVHFDESCDSIDLEKVMKFADEAGLSLDVELDGGWYHYAVLLKNKS